MRVLSIKVKPGARRSALTEQADGQWLAEVTAAPVDGKANEALLALVAKHFGLRRSQVRLASVAASRHKRVTLDE
jgi:uncharacterized protein